MCAIYAFANFALIFPDLLYWFPDVKRYYISKHYKCSIILPLTLSTFVMCFSCAQNRGKGKKRLFHKLITCPFDFTFSKCHQKGEVPVYSCITTCSPSILPFSLYTLKYIHNCRATLILAHWTIPIVRSPDADGKSPHRLKRERIILRKSRSFSVCSSPLFWLRVSSHCKE